MAHPFENRKGWETSGLWIEPARPRLKDEPGCPQHQELSSVAKIGPST